jgi:hypothetical protein
VDNICCDCWTEGCGCDGCFGCVADGLEAVNPAMEYVADLIWVCGSPLAFPLVFCFDSGPPTDPPGGGWQLPMIETPLRRPIQCCLFTTCCPCGQWYMRYRLLGGDMTKYKLWQGYHDGPHCCARRCPGAPCTIASGTYGEEKCPHAFLGAEVCCLAGAWSVCCSFDVNRRMIKTERNLGDDPTEVRVNKCIDFFSRLASQCFMLSCCVCVASCLVGCCAPGSEGAQDCSEQGQRAGGACRSCAMTCWRGIYSVKAIAMGCMSAQMDHEMKAGEPLASAPTKRAMDRGDGGTLDDDDADAWWKKP